MAERFLNQRYQVKKVSMKVIFHPFFFSVCLILFFGNGVAPVWAAQVQAVVDRTAVTLGESLELSVTIEGGDGEVDVSGIEAFKVISRGSSSSFQFINGRSSNQKIYSYTLLPLRDGQLTIPALPVEIDGKVQQTRPITIRVQKRAAAAQDSQDVFIKTRVSNDTPYVGQQINCTYSLFNAVQISDARFVKPEFTGFSAMEIQNQNSERTVINGREYIRRDLSYILIPRKSGVLNIEPAEIQLNVVQRSSRGRTRSPFDDFWGRSQVESRFLQSDSLSLTVKPLPPLPQSLTFSGLVGQFELAAQIEKTDLTVGDSITYSLTLKGNGNLAEVSDLRPSVPASFKSYKDSPQEEIELTPAGYEGKKIFRTALVPVKAGRYVLPAVTLTYFDVDKEKYATLATKPIDLVVSPATTRDAPTNRTTAGPSSKSKNEVVFTGRDILSLKEDLGALEHQAPLPLTVFLLWLFFPAAGYLGVKFVSDRLQKEDGRRKRQARQARKALKTAATADAEGKEYLSLLYRALVAAIRAGSDTKGESLTWAETENLLLRSGCDQETAREAARLLEEIESANYSGGKAGSGDRQSLLTRTKSMAGRLLK